jgi:2-polyprenyl-3-methyl-5-hydroxy-6-metoxy-1,4-benzoquinol methylase
MNEHLVFPLSSDVGDTPAPKARARAVYDYDIDLESNQSASRVARLVGRNKSVLEVGCGPGSQSRVFKEKLDCDVVGIEIDPDRAEKARTYCRAVHVANLETSNLGATIGDERFDVVVCADVLEHLRKPHNLLVEIKRFIKPDGYLVASIPNVTHAAIVYEMIHGRFEYRDEGLLDATHVKLFSCASALALLENAGYWVSDLQKARSQPQHTEFRTQPITQEDRQLLAAIQARNPDADTYQFIIKAHPFDDVPRGAEPAFSLREEVRQLQAKLSSYESELRRVQSHLDWYHTPVLSRFLKRFISRKNRAA